MCHPAGFVVPCLLVFNRPICTQLQSIPLGPRAPRPILTRQLRPCLGELRETEASSLDWSDQTLAFSRVLVLLIFYNYKIWSQSGLTACQTVSGGKQKEYSADFFPMRTRHAPISPCALGCRLIRVAGNQPRSIGSPTTIKKLKAAVQKRFFL